MPVIDRSEMKSFTPQRLRDGSPTASLATQWHFLYTICTMKYLSCTASATSEMARSPCGGGTTPLLGSGVFIFQISSPRLRNGDSHPNKGCQTLSIRRSRGQHLTSDQSQVEQCTDTAASQIALHESASGTKPHTVSPQGRLSLRAYERVRAKRLTEKRDMKCEPR